MARVLVTGASGFIGRHVVMQLSRDGYAVRATGRDAGRLAVLGRYAQTVRADLATDPLDALVDGCTAVVHCAALSSPWGRAEAFALANVEATARLLAAAGRTGAARFVHLGSPSIYFRFADQYDLDERFQPPRRWITAYARSKWQSEQLVRGADRGRLHTVILRPRAVFGDGDQAILPRLLAVAGSGRFPLIHAGRARIDITPVESVVHAIGQALQAGPASRGRAYNISNGTPVQVRALVQSLFEQLQMQVRLVPVPRALAVALAGAAELAAHCRPGRPEPRLTRYGVGVLGYSQTLDIRAARRDLGYAPALSIDAALARFAQAWHAGRSS